MSNQEEFNQMAFDGMELRKRLDDRIKWTRIMLSIETNDYEKMGNFQWLLQHLISLRDNTNIDAFQKVLEAAK